MKGNSSLSITCNPSFCEDEQDLGDVAATSMAGEAARGNMPSLHTLFLLADVFHADAAGRVREIGAQRRVRLLADREAAAGDRPMR